MNATLPTYEELCARKPNTALVTKKQSPFAMWVKDLFTPSNWERIFQERATVNMHSTLGGAFKTTGYYIVEVTTNLNFNTYKIYFSTGMRTFPITATRFILDYPEQAPLLDKHHIPYI